MQKKTMEILDYRYKLSKPKETPINGVGDLVEYFKKHFTRSADEKAIVVALTENNIVAYSVFRGYKKSVNLALGQVVRLASITNCDQIAILHNHLNNDCTPSSDDIDATETFRKYLEDIEVGYYGSIIIGTDNSYSFFPAKNDKLLEI